MDSYYSMFIMKYKTNMPNLADRSFCTGCMACSDSCAQKAITCVVDEDGHYFYQVEEEKCVLCHRCEKVCPIVGKMQYGTNDLKASQPYAAWATNEKLREGATSGGVFPAIAKSLIEQGGVVYGAVQEQFYVHHECIDKIDDISKLQGSKYTQSRTNGVFQKVKESLSSDRKVLFTGVGCQVAALLSFLKGNKNLDNLLSVDLICGGVPSSFLIKRFTEEFEDKVDKIVSFRTKSKYELTVIDKAGNKITLPSVERPLPLTGFTTGATERYICYNCPFAKGHRMSDITIGDFWGNSKYPEQNAKGVSVAIAHTEKGKQALQSAELEIYEINWRDFLFKNPRMVYGESVVPKTRKHLAKAFSLYSYERLLEDYANKGSWRRPVSILNRVLLILDGMKMTKKRQQKVEQLLKDNDL